MCHRSINYMAEMMETKFGIPWMKVNFIGAEATAKSLRKIAKYFDDQELIDRTEAVIAEEMAIARCWRRSAGGARARRPCCSWAARGRITTRTCSATSA